MDHLTPTAKHAHNYLLVPLKKVGNTREGGMLAVFELILCIIAAVVLSWFAEQYSGPNNLVPAAAKVILQKAMPMAG